MSRKSRSNSRRIRQNRTRKIQQAIPPDAALLTSIAGAARMLNRSESAIFELMREGKLKALKSGRRTVIPLSSMHEYIASLPPRRDGVFSGA